METQIDCQNLSFGYDGNIVVSGLNFSVKAGDFLLIAGETVPANPRL
jgi:ABC-type cobalamin/Fe3+-siderophores transport system ATPase subunit